MKQKNKSKYVKIIYGRIESIEILKKFIYEHTLFEMKEMTLLQIMLGIILCMDNIATLGIQRIDMLYNSVFKEENEDYKGIWNQNLSKISMGFLSTLIFIFKKFLGLH